MLLPIFQTKIQELILLQNKWSSILNALISNPSLQSSIISNIILSATKPTIINHLLGRKLVGWRIIHITGIASIFDQQANNQTPDVTLILQSNAAVTISIEVF